MCMSYSDSQLWLGDKSGQVNLVDASQGRFNFVKVAMFYSVYFDN